MIYFQDSSKVDKSYEGKIYPEDTKLKHDNSKVVSLLFKPNSLERDKCYKMKFSTALRDTKYDFELCTSKCACNSVGTSRCDEANGKCVCHQTFAGDDCSECAQGYA